MAFAAEANDFLFSHFSVERGLSCTQVQVIIQDRKGFIWVGTAEGLNRFDGFSFKSFLPIPGNPKSIQANNITQLYEDESGCIWIIFMSGEVSMYNPVDDSFRNYSSQSLKKIVKNFSKVTTIQDAGQLVLVGTDAGLLYYDKNEDEINHFKSGNTVCATTGIRSISKYNANKIWIATNNGYSFFDLKSNTFSDFKLPSYSFPSVNYIYKASNGYFWIASQNSLLYSIKQPQNPAKVNYQSLPIEGGRVFSIIERIKNEIWVIHDKGINVYNVNGATPVLKTKYFNSKMYYSPSGDLVSRSFLIDANYNLWFGDLKTDMGIFYYSASTGKIEKVIKDPDNPLGLEQYNVTAMFIDRSNNLWLGHDNAGLSMCALNKSPFNLKFQRQIGTDLSSDHIHSLYEDENSDLWVGTNNGIDVLDKTSGRVKEKYRFNPTNSNSLSGRIVGTITKDHSGNMWVGYLGGNPDIINTKTGRIYAFKYNEKIKNTANVWASMDIYVDKENTVWIATRGAGLAKYNNDGQTFTYYTPGVIDANITPVFDKNNHISDVQLYTMCEDKEGNLWIGTELGGLNRFNKKTGKFKIYTHSEKKNSISSNLVRYVFCDSEGTIWAGTNIGLNKFDKKTETFKRFTTQEGLVGNTVQGIVEATPGVLFISTNSGISRLDVKHETFSNYSTRNGLLSNEYSTGACIKRKSGELVFGSVNKGILSFFPENLNDSLPVPIVLISQLKIRNQEINVDKAGLLKKNILYSDKIEIPYYNSKDISIQFIALNYRFPESIIYRYMLKGHDQDWKTVDYSNRNAFYNQLKPDKYEFIVEASNDGINWGKPATINVTILPPWWNTWWFYFIITIALSGLVYYLYKRRIESFRKQQLILEKKVADRTAKLDKANSELELKNNELNEVNQLLENQNIEIQAISTELKELNELKTDFFTNISHELRTPLTIIKGLSESITEKMDKKDSKKFNEPITVIHKNVQLLIRQVNQLLNISLLDKGKLQPKIGYYNLKDFLTEITDTFNVLTDVYKVDFSCHIAENINKAYFDKDILEHTMFNLLSNAFKYTPDGGKIIFIAYLKQLENKPLELVFSIEDSGIGIKAEDIDRIFDRFRKNANKEYQRFESSGIGLPYCQEIISNHSGEIRCESMYGKGSKFTVTVPVSINAFPEEWIIDATEFNINKSDLLSELSSNENIKQNDDIDFNGAKSNILIVEDNSDLNLYLYDLLSPFYNVKSAFNGKEAIDMIENVDPEIVISDIMMPGMNGLELCKRLKENDDYSHIPVILLTARTSEQQQLEGLETGADDYITKPFNADILLQRVKNLITQKQKLEKYINSTFSVDAPGKDLPDEERIFLEKATKVVLDNLQNADFDVDQFCAAMYMSRTNLFRKLKQTTGLSATAFTNNIRVKQAAQLLRKKTHTVNEISYMVGFVDPSYFSRCFKKIYKVAPGSYH